MADTILASTASTAAIVVNGATVSSDIDTAGDADWWRVALTAGINYTIELTSQITSATPLPDPYFLGVYNSSGVLVPATSNDDASTATTNSLVRFTASSSGLYFLSAGAYSTYIGTYNLRIYRTDTIPANTSSTALLATGRSQTSAIDSPGDQDWWKVQLTAGVTYNISLIGSPSGSSSGLTLADPYLRGIYTSTGALIAGTTNDDYGLTTESRVRFTPTVSGAYFIAAGAYGSYTGSYRISLSALTSPDIAASTATTATLAVNGTQSSRIDTGGDQDWFKVTLTAGTIYTIDLTSDTSSSTPLSDPYFYGIYDSTGTLIPGTNNDDYGSTLNSKIQFTALSTGTYYLAAGAYSTYTGNYSIRLSTRAAAIDTIGASTATTGVISLGTTGVTGAVNFARDEDWYAVTLTAGQTYVIDLRGSASGQGTLTDPNFIGVYSSTGVFYAGTGNDNSANTTDAQTLFRAPTSGTYYLAAGASSDLTGSYRLTIDQSTSTDIPDNVTTATSVVVGGSLSGRIDTAGDEDWIKVSLTQGQSYQIRLRGVDGSGGTLTDPILAGVYTSSGQAITGTFNDDSNGTRDSQVTFTPTTTGTYFISTMGYGNATGTYTLSVANSTPTDTTAPILVSKSPADGSTNVAVGSNLSLTFNENVKAGSGSILIAGSGQSLSIPVTSSQVSFSGNVMTINPTANLLPGVNYTVTMGAGTVKDMAGNNFAGITNTTAFNFSTTASATPSDTWTIMVYIAADNNLESFAISDLNEMEMVNLPSNVNVVTLVDRIGGYDTTNGNWTDTRQGAIVHDSNTGTVTSFNSFTSLGELNTGSTSTLTNFINWAASGNSAQHYGLVVWDHGGGLSGAAWDDTNNDHLTSTELVSAIDASSVNKFDLIGYDACLMGMVEQAWDMRSLTDVYVASEELIPGNGWAYDRWLGTLAANPNMTAASLGSAIVTSYGQEYAGQSDITLSAVNTASLSVLNTRLNQFVTDALGSSTTAADWTAMRTAASHTIFYPSDSTSYNYRDLGQFMSQLTTSASSTTLRTDAANVVTALDNAVFAQTGTVAGATGLSIYLPYGSTAVSSTYTSANHSFLASSSWENFLAVL